MERGQRESGPSDGRVVRRPPVPKQWRPTRPQLNYVDKRHSNQTESEPSGGPLGQQPSGGERPSGRRTQHLPGHPATPTDHRMVPSAPQLQSIEHYIGSVVEAVAGHPEAVRDGHLCGALPVPRHHTDSSEPHLGLHPHQQRKGRQTAGRHRSAPGVHRKQ